MILSKEVQLEFTHLFLDCSNMRDKDACEIILSLLPDEVASRIIAGDNNFMRVFRIVEKCSEYEEGIELLAYLVFKTEGNTKAWQQLDRFVQKIFCKAITYKERQELLLKTRDINWPENVLQKAYQDSIPELRSSHRFAQSNMFELMLKDLGGIFPQDEDDMTPPVLEFVERLALYAHEQRNFTLRDDLRVWVDEKVIISGLSDMQARVLHNKASRGRIHVVETSPYLLIVIQPNDNESMYSIQAWLLDSHYKVIDVGIVIDDSPVPIQRIPDLIKDVFRQILSIESLVATIDDLVIEVSLPRELLYWDVDSWLITVGFSEVRLGFQYRVVVRSFERSSKFPSLRPSWYAKWRIFQKFIEGKYELRGDPIWICNGEECQTHNLRRKLRGTSIVCFALAHTLPPVSSQESHPFNTLLETGIPIALWPRKQLNDLDAFKALLSYDTLNTLPSVIWEQRKEAEGEELHMGRHLTLLWDDPSRLPPNVTARPLVSPKKRGS